MFYICCLQAEKTYKTIIIVFNYTNNKVNLLFLIMVKS